jgi:hypothetical protein
MKERTLLFDVCLDFVIGTIGYGCWYFVTTEREAGWVLAGIVKSILCGFATGFGAVIYWALFKSGSRHFGTNERNQAKPSLSQGRGLDQEE